MQMYRHKVRMFKHFPTIYYLTETVMVMKHKCWPDMTSILNQTEAENCIRSSRVWSDTSTSIWDSSLVIYRLLWFTWLVPACLVKSHRSKSEASTSQQLSKQNSHLSDLTVHQQAGSHNRHQSKRELAKQSLCFIKPPFLLSAIIFSSHHCSLNTGQYNIVLLSLWKSTFWGRLMLSYNTWAVN